MSDPASLKSVLTPLRAPLGSPREDSTRAAVAYDVASDLTGPRRIKTLLISAGALLTLVAGLVGLVTDSAGLAGQWLPYVGVLMLFGLPALVSEQRFWPKSLLAIFTAMFLVTFLSLLYAPIRSAFPSTLLIECGMFLAASSASYLFRRLPKVLISVFVVTGLVWAVRAVYSWLTPLAPGEQRLLSPLGQWNASAAFYGALAVLALGGALLAKNTAVRAVCGVAAGAGVSALWLTGSRGGLGAFLVALAALIILTRPTWRTAIVSGLLALLVAVLATLIMNAVAPHPTRGGAQIIPQTQSTSNTQTGILGRTQSVTGDFGLRLKYWESAVKITEQHPVFGVGPGSWQDVSWRYMTPTEDWSTAAHNWVLQTFAEQGVLGGLALLGLFGIVGTALWKKRRLRAGPYPSLVAGATSATILIGAHSLIDFDNRWPALMFLLAASAGVVMGSFSPNIRPGVGRVAVLVPMSLLVVLQIGGVYFGAQASKALGSPLGSNPDYNITYAIGAADSYLSARDSAGFSTPLAGNALVAVQSSMPFNPGDPRLVLMADLAQYYSLHMDAAQLLYAINHQSLSPWTEIYGSAATAFDAHRQYSYEYKVAMAGVAINDANPGWDPTRGSQETLYEEALRALDNAHPCDTALLIPVVHSMTKDLVGATPQVQARAASYRASMRAVCPSLSPYLKN